MTERDYWGIMLILGLMTLSQYLHGRTLDLQFKVIGELQEEVAFLRDVTQHADASRDDHV